MINPVYITGFFMSNAEPPDLLNFIQQTERAVTSVTEVLGSPNRHSPPTNSQIPPVPLPSSPSSDEESRVLPDAESVTDEIQDAWLATLDLKINELKVCLDSFSTSLSAVSKDVQSLEADARIKNAEADGKITDNGLREQMATRTYSFMRIWCTFVGVIIFFYVAANQFNPPKEVIIALMGTTTISIVGLVGFVVSGLFKSNNKVDK